MVNRIDSIMDILQERVKTRLRLPENLQFIQSGDVEWTEVGDGNLNDVIRIASRLDPSKSVILKHAPPYIKLLGPEYPLTTDRNNIEYAALVKFYEICPGLVPEPYFCDEEEHILLMEDLRGYGNYQEEITKAELDDKAVMDIADFTLRLHKFTHKRHIPAEQFDGMVEGFRNDEMVDITDQYIFTKPWVRGDPTNRSSEGIKGHHSLVYDDQILLEHVKDLRHKFLSEKECLLHGDLHTGSAMTDGRNAKVIDAEFAFVGPAAFDVGMLIANYIFYYHAHLHYPLENAPDFHQTVKIAVRKTIEHYFGGMSPLLRQTEMEALTQDTAGYAGCELIRRIVGAARVAYLEVRPLAEISSFKLGVTLIRRHKELKNYQELISILGVD